MSIVGLKISVNISYFVMKKDPLLPKSSWYRDRGYSGCVEGDVGCGGG